MRLIFLGPPGAGKGTMAKKLSKSRGLLHLSTGDLLRANIKEKTALGKEAVSFVENGKLVPDQLVIEMMRHRLREQDARKGFILDGFPRTTEQAKALDGLLGEENMKLDHAVNFDASDGKIIERLSGRRICGKCGAIYHLKNIPPKQPGICDQCGGSLVQRKDDNEETVRRRLEVYREETAPLIEYYERQNLLRTVPGELDVHELEPIVKKILA